MNSEELEQSLRTEFESYLKNVLADMRQEVADFQKQFEAEFEKHKSQIDEVFQNFLTRVVADRVIDASFTESVVEHLRLSRDEGARITAMAIAEAEELEKQKAAQTESEAPASPAFSFSEIRDAINDISTKTTQSTILKTLVQHASQFTPRGAFFIIKNEHLVGWRMFGKDGETVDEQTVREVFLPAAASTVLGEAVRSLSAVESAYGVYGDDSIYLNKLEFGQPEQMFAVPLVVRGRSVAVLYADQGENGSDVNIDALEALVRVASMTVEILASSRGAQTSTEAAEETSANYGFEQASQEQKQTPETVEQATSAMKESYQFAETSTPNSENGAAAASAEQNDQDYSYSPAVEEDYSYQPIQQPAASFETTDQQSSFEGDSFSFKPSAETEEAPAEFISQTPDEDAVEEEKAPEYETEPAWNQTVGTEDFYSQTPSISYEAPQEIETPVYEISESQSFETEAKVAENEYVPGYSGDDYQFETEQSFQARQSEFESSEPQPFEETPQYETPSFETPQYETESAAVPTNGAYSESNGAENGRAESYVAETPVIETVSAESAVKPAGRSRFSERNVDLPIDVSEDERRHHNDARRFARLLVSEIKLYNEQKVKEGRESSDLYDRLREAIDRSREMYDKRVTPAVAAKFDYFHYELVSNLAEGDQGKLGASYPGSDV